MLQSHNVDTKQDTTNHSRDNRNTPQALCTTTAGAHTHSRPSGAGSFRLSKTLTAAARSARSPGARRPCISIEGRAGWRTTAARPTPGRLGRRAQGHTTTRYVSEGLFGRTSAASLMLGLGFVCLRSPGGRDGRSGGGKKGTNRTMHIGDSTDSTHAPRMMHTHRNQHSDTRRHTHRPAIHNVCPSGAGGHAYAACLGARSSCTATRRAVASTTTAAAHTRAWPRTGGSRVWRSPMSTACTGCVGGCTCVCVCVSVCECMFMCMCMCVRCVRARVCVRLSPDGFELMVKQTL